jgi:ethanolamine ammonia-lyase small subunit
VQESASIAELTEELKLRNFTMARVALARTGTSLATREVLAFQAAHAAARDSVHLAMDAQALELECEARGWPAVTTQSAASDRGVYLRRPDLGRKLASQERLPKGAPYEVAVVIADGLSALAVHRHALALCSCLFARLEEAGWRRSPLVFVEQGRVAIGDEIGEALQAEMSLVLIGERPGLSAADSLGAYLTWLPRPGRTDAERNCISNIRPGGLGYEEAADRIFFLMRAARGRKLTGVQLKEGSEAAVMPVVNRNLGIS